MKMQTFLARAVRLELEAETIYRNSAEALEATNNADAAAFFREMAGYSHLHYEDAMRRGGFDDLSDVPEMESRWPDGKAPDAPEPPPPGKTLDLGGAIALALDAERRAVEFYANVARTSSDPQVISLAEEVAGEEREHVLALERFKAWKMS